MWVTPLPGITGSIFMEIHFRTNSKLECNNLEYNFGIKMHKTQITRDKYIFLMKQ